jgi:hypothetical protein
MSRLVVLIRTRCKYIVDGTDILGQGPSKNIHRTDLIEQLRVNGLWYDTMVDK